MAASIVIILIGGLAFAFYFAAQVSAVYPHLKNYEYSTSAKQLETTIIQALKSDTCFSCTITKSTGTEDHRNYYMTIEQNFNKHTLSYHITYSDIDESSCNLGLVGVFDKTNRSGGYKNEDKDVEQLISIFEEQVINKIE